MSDSNHENDPDSKISESSIEPRPSTAESEPDPNNRASLQNLTQTNALLSTIKADTSPKKTNIECKNESNEDDIQDKNDTRAKEVSIHIENITSRDFKTAKAETPEDIVINTDIVTTRDNTDTQIIKSQLRTYAISLDDATGTDAEFQIQAKEIVINLDDYTGKYGFADKNVGDKDCLTYREYGQQIRPPRSIWVMYEADGAPLNYEPSRNDFIRLVFIILLIMLLVTAAFVGTVLAVEDLKDIFQTYGMMIALPAMIIMVGLSYSIACSPCTRMFPCNIVILCVAVICMSIICAYITSRYSTEIVLLALLATCLVVLICVGLAFSGFDFTSIMLYIVLIAAAFGAVSMIAGITMLITRTYIPVLRLVILLVGTIINVLVLTMEIQLVLGGGAVELGENEYALAAFLLYTSIVLTMELQMVLGGGAVEIGEDEYALAAFLLYTSIVDIFLKLVQITGILEDMDF